MTETEQKLYNYVKEVGQLATDARELLDKRAEYLTNEIKEYICLIHTFYGRLQFINMFKEKLGVKKAEVNARYIYLDVKDISSKIRLYMETITL